MSSSIATKRGYTATGNLTNNPVFNGGRYGQRPLKKTTIESRQVNSFKEKNGDKKHKGRFHEETEAVKNMTSAEVAEFRSAHMLTVRGDDVPNPFRSFEETGFPSYILRQFEADHFDKPTLIQAQAWAMIVMKKDVIGVAETNSEADHFDKPTPIQAQAWAMIVTKKDVIGVADTGSGKTLAFLLPGLVLIKGEQARGRIRPKGPTLVVLTPTRELAMQVHSCAQKYSQTAALVAHCVYGGQPKYGQRNNLRQRPDIVVATPGRCIDFMEEGSLWLGDVMYMVLDEADRMLDMGFEDQVRKIMNATPATGTRQTLLFSATWPRAVEQLAASYLFAPLQVNVGSTGTHANHAVKQYVDVVNGPQKMEFCLNVVLPKALEIDENPKVLMFCATKRVVDLLCGKLRAKGTNAMAIHGDKEQTARDFVLRHFRDGKCNLMVATDVAQRGLDVKGVTAVINYDFPNNIEDYVHRIGRTGRAGKTGTAFTILTSNDAMKAGSLVKVLEEAGQTIPDDLHRLCNSPYSSFQRDVPRQPPSGAYDKVQIPAEDAAKRLPGDGIPAHLNISRFAGMGGGGGSRFAGMGGGGGRPGGFGGGGFGGGGFGGGAGGGPWRPMAAAAPAATNGGFGAGGAASAGAGGAAAAVKTVTKKEPEKKKKKKKSRHSDSESDFSDSSSESSYERRRRRRKRRERERRRHRDYDSYSDYSDSYDEDRRRRRRRGDRDRRSRGRSDCRSRDRSRDRRRRDRRRGSDSVGDAFLVRQIEQLRLKQANMIDLQRDLGGGGGGGYGGGYGGGRGDYEQDRRGGGGAYADDRWNADDRDYDDDRRGGVRGHDDRFDNRYVAARDGGDDDRDRFEMPKAGGAVRGRGRDMYHAKRAEPWQCEACGSWNEVPLGEQMQKRCLMCKYKRGNKTQTPKDATHGDRNDRLESTSPPRDRHRDDDRDSRHTAPRSNSRSLSRDRERNRGKKEKRRSRERERERKKPSYDSDSDRSPVSPPRKKKDKKKKKKSSRSRGRDSDSDFSEASPSPDRRRKDKKKNKKKAARAPLSDSDREESDRERDRDDGGRRKKDKKKKHREPDSDASY